MRNAVIVLLAMALVGFSGTDDVALVARHSVLPTHRRLGKRDALIVVSIKQQRMVVSFGLASNVSYRVSTAANGVGASADSDCTPPGWHRVHSRFGGKAQIGQVFRSRRVSSGEVLPEAKWRGGGGDLVVSRIFWLEGMEPGVNKDKRGEIDSFLRYIYIHGTNEEEKLGTPSSHGCIRMGNRDIVCLYNQLKPYENVYVYIE